MMSKIKSPKTAAVKLTMGLLTAAALVVVFACEQKEMEEVKTTSGVEALSVTIVDDSKLMVQGGSSELKRISEMMSGSREFAIETDSLGNLLLVKKSVPRVLDQSENIFFVVEQMPEFPGGELALRKFIANNIQYPEIAQKNGIQGRVYVTFIVDKEGNVANAAIARGVDPSIDQEALRVVNNLPRWYPGVQKGEPVNVSYTVPINFALQ